MQSPYQILGEQGIRQLVDTFYDVMDSSPQYCQLRAMHAADLSAVRGKLSEYLIGWMGGPPIYAKKYGSICMTTPHKPYKIGATERDAWLACMQDALAATGASEELRTMLQGPLFQVADMVKNSDD